MGIVTKLKSGGSSGTEHLISSSAYGTCATAAGTATKEVVLSSFDTLTVGMTIHIKFTNANSVANPTLKIVASSGGTALVDTKPIYRYGTTAPSTSAATSWQAGSVVSLTYDGVGWIINDWLNDNSTYYYESIYCVTAANEAAKVGTSSGYTLQPGHFQIWIKNSNTAQSALTLNISGKGAKPIYINGSASSSTNYTLPLGYYLAYYDGTNYYFRTDGKITAGDILGTVSGNVTNVAWDSTNKKLTKTLGTTTTDVVTADQLKTGLGLGSAAYTASTDYATSGHTHTTSIATSSGTNALTLAFGTKYALTAGGTSYIFTMPSNPNTNTTYSFTTGDNNGEIKVTPSSGTAYPVAVKGLGSAAYTASTDYATSGHTHTTTIADGASGDTNQKTLAFGTKYKLTAGGTNYIFTMPSNPNTNALYSIGSSLSSHKITTSLTASGSGGTSTSTDFTLVAGDNITLTDDTTNRKITIASTNPEASLTWGGKDFSASYGPIDAAMIDLLGANRFAFLKAAGITVEYSTNGGSSYSDYGATDAQKVGLFSSGQGFYLGKHTANGSCTTSDRLRVTIDTGAASIYTVLNKIAIYMSTSGATVEVLIEKALQSTPTTYTTHKDWTGISGWSGWNILNISGLTTYGNTAASQYGRIRFTFRQTAVNTNYSSASISKIQGYGGMGWTVPSNMAANGHLYSYDSSQNATFPAKVTATSFVGTATGNLTNVAWDSTNSRFTRTKNGTTEEIITIANLKTALGLGTAAYTASTDYATSGHTHTTTIAAAGTNDTSSLTLGFGTKYKLTAGDTNYIFTMPANPDTNALYSISSALSSHKLTTSLTASGTGGTSTSTDFTLAAGNYISLTDDTDNRKITIASTDHTYTLTNALSSHKFTWTFTAGGSGSGSTTTTAELVAGTGISLTDDTTNKKITIENVIAKYDTLGGVKPWYSHTAASSGPTTGSNATAITVQSLSTSASRYYAIESDSNGRLFVNVPWTDTHSDLATVDPTTETTGYITWYEGSTIGTNVTLSANNGLVYVTKNGTTSDVGYGALRLGNTTGSGSDGNKQGKIYLYSDSSGYGVLQQASTTATVTNTLPTTTGTLINSAGGQTINGDLTITGTLWVNESTIPHL